ncbi:MULTISPECIES: GTPase HflX [Metallosphaera]|uniref:GTP-binding protein HflX n=3 Tax=Metallosphaera TaxID=41980 RepID=A4YJ13_METS5|nr:MULTISPECIES: GTPase HflX [Metallosphaera]ABP96415.1 GTP-binding protein HflX [Metallosphaera sedula DSM 5348]AIM28398.1 GTP-binding protein HflX [Metallosphaera sedula]AKV75184.1 GTPase HflX [Metallosphaera sedula]AKV77420.1 GTPase HflX [Metallosphaera sedula]AKV79672.1 GTPase HflX [Metallosphaera sedula]
MKATLFVSQDFADEAVSLLETAGYEVEKTYPLPSKPNRLYYIPQDKLKLLQDQETDAVVVFDLLSPRHFINLNRSLNGKKVLDKLLILLEIFALHAGSKEAKLQIELARLKYELPIIKDIYSKTKISEQQGPLGAGTYGVESALRLYNRKISKITKELEGLKKFREMQMQNRREEFPYVAITGYTNAGKTSIFNALTGLNKPTDQSMFTTTAPKRYAIPIGSKKVTLVDTVGFIRGIPPQIIDAFFVTLSEIRYANALLLVVDISLEDSLLLEMTRSSFEILRELGISGKPMIIVGNKADLVDGRSKEKMDMVYSLSDNLYSPVVDAILVSAKKGWNLDSLRDKIFSLVN